MLRRISNIDRIKFQLRLNQQVKELLSANEIDLDKPFHFEIIVAILQKEQKSRNQQDLNVLSRALSAIKYFREMAKSTSEDEMLNLYRELQYINLPAKRTLFRSGAIGRNFYVILRGSVWVLVGKQGLGDMQVESKHEKYDEGEESVLKLLSFKDEDEFAELENDKMLEHKYPHMMRVGRIEQGGSFGEIALTNAVPRQATIVCAEDCQLIKLSREAFNRFLSDYYTRIQAKNFDFLKAIPMFQDWSDADINVIQYHLETFEYSMNAVLFKEGDPINGVYFITSGSVELQKQFKMNSGMGNKQIALSRYDTGQMFGFMEILESNTSRTTKAVCLTEKVKTLFIQADRFKLYCCQNESLHKLKQNVKKLNEVIRKTTKLYEQTTKSVSSLSLNLTNNNDSYLQRLKTEINPPFKTSRSRVIKRSVDLLGNISHQSSTLQNYCDFVQQIPKDSLGKLNLANPLISIELSKRVKMQQLQFQLLYSPSMRIPQFSSGESRQTIIRQLKLPSISRQQEEDHRISIRQLDPVV